MGAAWTSSGTTSSRRPTLLCTPLQTPWTPDQEAHASLVPPSDAGPFMDLRCDHPMREQTDAKGRKYMASHPSSVGVWIKTNRGKERISKSLGEYNIAMNFALDAWLERELRRGTELWVRSPSRMGTAWPSSSPSRRRSPSATRRTRRRSGELGRAVGAFLDHAVSSYPQLSHPASAILAGKEPNEFPKLIIEAVRSSILTVLNFASGSPRQVQCGDRPV